MTVPFRLFLMTTAAVGLVGIGAAQAQSTLTLETITVLAEKVRQRAIDALAGVSAFDEATIEETRPARVSELLFGMPGVWVRESNANPATAINIRGLQDFGRVAVIVDGARQNFQTSGHNANGVFFVDPAMLAGGDVIRGPVSNIYGSGAIGGVASFRTKDAEDVLREGERAAAELSGVYRPNGELLNGAAFLAARPTEAFDAIVGVSKTHSENYKDGNGNVVTNTGNDTLSALAKLTLRPGEGHEIKLGATHYEVDYPDNTYLLENGVVNDNFTGKYTYSSPDVPMIDFAGSAYLTQTRMHQESASRVRDFDIETVGFDVNNTSRFDALGLEHALTYGGDWFRDNVETADTLGYGDLYTPSGERNVGGAFLQWKAAYNTWLEVIGAARYDTYSLQGGDTSMEGSRLSPKITVGVTPTEGLTFYGTYAEGYRAPSITETLIGGAHPPAMPLITCPDGTEGIFCFIPNPDLRPEVGKSLEFGINADYADVLTEGDKFQVKANVFRNNVDDFIELVEFGPPTWPGVVDYSYVQYQNIAHAKIHGVELEGTYDAGRWFAGFAGHYIQGENADTADGLNTVPPTQTTVHAGARFFDRKLSAAVRWQHVWAKGTYAAYDLVGLSFGWEPNESTVATLVVDNLLDAYYVPYLGDPTKPSPGISVKAGLTVRLGAQ